MPAEVFEDHQGRMVHMHVRAFGLVHDFVSIYTATSVNWALVCGRQIGDLDPGCHVEEPVTCIGCAAHIAGHPHPWQVRFEKSSKYANRP